MPGTIFLLVQTGQPLPLTRAETAARHSWPLSQTHQTLRRVPGTTSAGVRSPFLVGCHWRASSGLLVARSLTPRRSARLLQTGQPAPETRLLIWARHSWPWGHCHQTRRWLPGSTSDGVRSPFLVGCHSAARSGERVARSVSPGTGKRPEQYGQPVPLPLRVWTAACQLCPFAQRQKTRRLLPRETVSGVSGRLRSLSHSAR